MSNTAIQVEGVGKRYLIGAPEVHRRDLRDTLVHAAKAPLRNLRRIRRLSQFSDNGDDDIVWALRDISFEVQSGEVLGIIGRNGAGKSTLLKILSRITSPTKGRVTVRGRVGALLEVGTGFHAELSGRENVYLNGSILGMDKRYIDRQFDAIVEFSGVSRFIDTPVKRYSSGMYLRLAFAVAAHLEPEILVVDEVLAVGDMEFQRKCMGKMGEVAGEGRTVLFVSHNLAAVQALCHRAILLNAGQVVADGPVEAVTAGYMDPVQNDAVQDLGEIRRTGGNGRVRLSHAAVQGIGGALRNSFAVWEPIVVEMEAVCPEPPRPASFWLLVRSSTGVIVLSAFQYDVMPPVELRDERTTVRARIDPNGLVPGTYTVSLGSFGPHNELYDWVDDILTFEVRAEFSTGKPFDHRLGLVSPRQHWEVG